MTYEIEQLKEDIKCFALHYEQMKERVEKLEQAIRKDQDTISRKDQTEKILNKLKSDNCVNALSAIEHIEKEFLEGGK